MNKHQKSNRKLIALGILASSVLLAPIIPLLNACTQPASANTSNSFPSNAEDLKTGKNFQTNYYIWLSFRVD